MGRAVLVCVLMGMAAFFYIADSAVVLPYDLNLTLPSGVDGVLVALFQLFGYAFHAAWIAAAIAFAIWLYRVVRNMPALGADLLMSPVWAVVCLFIPFVNLYLPFFVVHHAWQASEPEPDVDRRNVRGRFSMLVVGWWTAWLVAGPVSLFVEAALLGYFLPSSQSGLIPWYISYPRMALFSGTVVLAVVVVLGLSRRQEARLRRLAAEARDRGVAQAASVAGA